MAISVTEILGTDSISGSRLVINDNFNILAAEINSIENYINPSAGTITNLNDLRTEAFRVGLSTVLLDINASTFDILTDVDINNGDLTITGGGLIRNDVDPQVLNDTFAGASLTINVGTSTAVPPYTIERVGNGNTSALNILLNDGTIGQEIFVVQSEANTGAVEIKGAVNALVLPGAGATPTLTLNEKGDTVHLLCIDDGTGNGDWYLVVGNGYAIS